MLARLALLCCFALFLGFRPAGAEESWRDFDAELGSSYELDPIDLDAFESAFSFNADPKTAPDAAAKTPGKTSGLVSHQAADKAENPPPPGPVKPGFATFQSAESLPAANDVPVPYPQPAPLPPVAFTNTVNEAVAKKAEQAAAAKAAEESGKNLYQKLLYRSEVIEAELARLMHQVENPEIGEDRPPQRELSLRKNASVTIGGEVRTDFTNAQSTWRDPSFDPGDPSQGKGKADFSEFRISTAKLLLDARAGERWRAYLDINLQGYNGRHEMYRTVNPNAPVEVRPPTKEYAKYVDQAFVGQAYVEMLKKGHSGFGALLGLMRLPFGLWNRPNQFTQSYMDGADLSTSYLMGTEGWRNGVRLPHASRSIDPATALMVNYEWRDIIRFEAAFFVEKNVLWEREEGRGGDSRLKATSYEQFPRSWQLGLSLQPLEGWELTTHLRNRHRNDRGVGYWANSPYRWDFRRNLASGKNDPHWDGGLGQWSDHGDGEAFGSAQNEQAWIIGLAVEVPNTKLAVQVEYARGWNQGFNENIRSDGVNVGLTYQVTPKLTVNAGGEWLRVKDGSWMARDKNGGWVRDCHDNNLFRASLGAEYEVARGLTIEAGWQYEYWRINSARGGPNGVGERRVNRSNMFYAGTRFVF